MIPAPLPMLRQIREARGWTRLELARRAGCSKSTIEVAEGVRGCKRGISLWVATHLADALDVGLDALRAVDMPDLFARQRQSYEQVLLGYRARPYKPGELRRAAAAAQQDHGGRHGQAD